jgi:hypothetical protein
VFFNNHNCVLVGYFRFVHQFVMSVVDEAHVRPLDMIGGSAAYVADLVEDYRELDLEV